MNTNKTECESGNQLLKVVHIVIDDKFVDMAYREFEAVATGRNIFIMLESNEPLKYVKTSNITCLSYNDIAELVNSSVCSSVVFHSFISRFIPILKAIPLTKKVIWLGWGFDYYRLFLTEAFSKGLILNETALLIANKPVPISYYFSRVLEKIKEYLLPEAGAPISFESVLDNPKLMQRVDYFCPVIDIEYKMALELNGWFRPKYIPWNYGTLEDDWSLENNQEPLGENILIGNSASPENNHLEVFTYIKNNIDYSSRKIIVPLSYGEEWYKKSIIKRGYKLFGASFVPMVDFVGKDRYIEILRSCGYVFMNHIRQQALGNICITMSLGAKLYMNSASPLYRWLIDRGALIYTIDFLKKSTESPHKLFGMSEQEQFQNAEVIRAHWGRDIQRLKTRNLIDLALDRSSDYAVINREVS